MSLRDGYGVLAGTLHKYYCDRKTDDRTYYHCNIKVRSRGKLYLCPVDLDSKNDANGLQWRVVDMTRDDLGPVSEFQEGWHFLKSRRGSGALDYYRSEALMPTGRIMRRGIHDALRETRADEPQTVPVWKHGTGVEAFADLEPLLSDPGRLFIYGERFRVGLGVHNIHQNQGDPPVSPWHYENGPWQDGGVAVLRKDASVSVFLCKFKTQKFFPPALEADFRSH